MKEVFAAVNEAQFALAKALQEVVRAKGLMAKRDKHGSNDETASVLGYGMSEADVMLGRIAAACAVLSGVRVPQ